MTFHHRGMTLVELLLALALTGIVAAAAAAMLGAVAYGSDSRHDMRSLVTRSAVLSNRLNTAIHGAHQVLAGGSNFIVLWMADTDGDGKPSLAEMQRLEWNDATDELVAYAGTDAASTAGNDLGSDFDAITKAAKGGSAFPAMVWARQVADWTFSLDQTDPQQARLVSYRGTLATADSSGDANVVGAAALPN